MKDAGPPPGVGPGVVEKLKAVQDQAEKLAAEISELLRTIGPAVVEAPTDADHVWWVQQVIRAGTVGLA